MLLLPARLRLSRSWPFVAIAALGLCLVAVVWAATQSRISSHGASDVRTELLLAIIRSIVLLALTVAAMAGVQAHRRSMRRLERAQERYRQIFANTSDCMFVLNVTPDNRFSFEALNPAEEAATGLSSAEVRGRYVEEILDPVTTDLVTSHYRQCLETQAAICYDERLEFAGGVRDFCTTLVPIRNASGRISGIVGLAREITELKRAEEAVRRLNDQLEERVAERTTELAAANAALVAAMDETERASRAKSDFLATVSHEIRTPMNGMLGALELLTQSHLGADDAELVATARGSGVTLLALLNDVLDMAKVEASRMEIVTAPLALAALVERTLATHRVNARRKGLELSARIDIRLPEWVSADELRLGQILGNLVSNAIKFTERGSVKLEATFVEDRGDAVRVRFRVTDTGCGIEASTLDRLFRPFERGPQKPGLGERGAGLGLAISLALCNRMEGTLSIESTAGAGTAATLELDVDPAAPQCFAEDGPNPGGALGARVLVVDDHPINRMILLRQLMALGCVADACADGIEALRCLEERRHELVITDCEMPGMDGYELARTIRASERRDGAHRSMPLIACSAHPAREIRERCLDAGIDAVLQKPVLLADLAGALIAHLPQVQAVDVGRDRLAESQDRRLPIQEPHSHDEARKPADDSPPIDLEILAEISGGDKSLGHRLLSKFQECNANDAQWLRQAALKGELEQVVMYSHRMKGASRTIGAHGLARICEALERSGKAADVAGIIAHIPAFDMEIARLDVYGREWAAE